MSFANIHYEYSNKNIHLWEFDENGKRKYSKHKISHRYYVDDPSGQSEIKDIYGKPVVLKTTMDKKSISMIKESGVQTHEANISEDVKFLHDHYKEADLTPTISNFNVCSLDIEVSSDDTTGFPYPEEAKFPINLITVKMTKTGEMYSFGIYDYTGGNIKNYYYNPDEKKMLDVFCTFMRKSKVDIITGWNIYKKKERNSEGELDDDCGFDIPYILNRAEKLGVEYQKLSPINIVEKNQRGEWNIAGISLLDYMALYKKFAMDKQESYRLNYISLVEIGEGKMEFDGSINQLWKTDWNKYVEYNNQDVLLVDKLEQKLKFIELAIMFAYNSMVPLEKILSPLAVLQGYILKELHNNGKVLIDNDHGERKTYPGAYVLAREGFYKHVISFDVESLYPHRILTDNISPETIVTHTEIEKIERLRAEGNLITTEVGRDSGYLNPDNGIVQTFNPIYYDKSIENPVVPTVVRKMIKDRREYKRLSRKYYDEGHTKLSEYYNMRSYIQKISVNSLYGIIANPHFALYDVRNAMAITLGGQDLIQYLSGTVRDYLQKVGYLGVKMASDPVILIDTDSVHLTLDELYMKTKKDGEEYLQWARKIETDCLNPFFKKIITIYANKHNSYDVINFKRENISSKYMIQAKKKYAVEILDSEGKEYKEPKLKITGIEIKRSDTPSFCREYILQIVKDLFYSNQENYVLEKLREIKTNFMKQDIHNIAINKGVSEYTKYATKTTEEYIINGLEYPKHCPIHVRASMNYNVMNEKYKLGGLPIVNGSKMKFVHVFPNNILKQDVIGFQGNWNPEFNKYFKVDYETQWKRTFETIIQRFFNCMKWGEINLDNEQINNFIEF